MIEFNLHIYPTPFRFESRILKETNSLINLQIVKNIEIASLWDIKLNEFEKIDEERSVKRFRLFTNNFGKNKMALAFRYFEFICRVFFYYRKKKIEYVNCHSLMVLIVGVLLKKFGNSTFLIYDAHELETERNGLTGLAQKFTKLLEKKLIAFVDKTIVVCEPIADWYRNEYNLQEIFVIQNMPHIKQISNQKSTILKDKFKIPYNEVLFIYQGILEKGRGIELLINLFAKCSNQKHIVFMGFGSLENEVKKSSVSFTNIHYQPAVKPTDIIAYTESADIGVFFIEGEICLSYEFSLPNKFGEYLMAGLPVLVSSSLTYMSQIIQSKNCGWSIKSENELFEFISGLEFSELNKKLENVKKYSLDIGWEKEELILNNIYNAK